MNYKTKKLIVKCKLSFKDFWYHTVNYRKSSIAQ